MFVRVKRSERSGQVLLSCQLAESYRTEVGPRQRVVAHLCSIQERYTRAQSKTARVARAYFWGRVVSALAGLVKRGLIDEQEAADYQARIANRVSRAGL